MNASSAKRRQGENAKAEPAENRPVFTRIPFQPRRKLFLILMVLFALWVACLVVMYFKTVYPHRHPATSTTQTTRLASFA